MTARWWAGSPREAMATASSSRSRSDMCRGSLPPRRAGSRWKSWASGAERAASTAHRSILRARGCELERTHRARPGTRRRPPVRPGTSARLRRILVAGVRPHLPASEAFGSVTLRPHPHSSPGRLRTDRNPRFRRDGLQRRCLPALRASGWYNPVCERESRRQLAKHDQTRVPRRLAKPQRNIGGLPHFPVGKPRWHRRRSIHPAPAR